MKTPPHCVGSGSITKESLAYHHFTSGFLFGLGHLRGGSYSPKKHVSASQCLLLVDVSDFFPGRGGEGGGGRGGSVFLFKITGQGGGCFQEREGPGGCLERIGEFGGGGGGG